MSADDSRSRLMTIFTRLRHRGVLLGVGELLDALRAVDGGWGVGDDEVLRRVARLLWCRTPAEEGALEDAWAEPEEELTEADLDQRPDTHPAPPPPDEKRPDTETGKALHPAPPPDGEKPSHEWVPLPVRPPALEAADEAGPDLLADRPISRRSMAYAWRYLQRPAPDGPEDVLDVDATVGRVARQGVFLAPVYRRRVRNHAHLTLLPDQNGSMMPFHRFTRDLVETARFESTIPRVETYYFHNVPGTSVSLDPHLTSPVPWDQAAAGFSGETAVLIVSDAGAARGHWRLNRVRATTKFLVRLRQLTEHVAWLNPIPEGRWQGTTAEAVARLVPMFPMDTDGLANAVDALRGLVSRPDRR